MLTLFHHPGRWSAVVDAIATGQEPWLEIAVGLQPSSDGQAGEDLDLAIGEAFLKSPEAVLGRFGPAAACGSLGFAEQRAASEAELLAASQNRRALAEGLSSSAVQELKKECLAELDKLKQEYLK